MSRFIGKKQNTLIKFIIIMKSRHTQGKNIIISASKISNCLPPLPWLFCRCERKVCEMWIEMGAFVFSFISFVNPSWTAHFVRFFNSSKKLLSFVYFPSISFVFSLNNRSVKSPVQRKYYSFFIFRKIRSFRKKRTKSSFERSISFERF